MTDDRAVFPPLEQSVAGALDTHPNERKFCPALCYQGDQEKC